MPLADAIHENEVKAMRMKAIKVVRAATHWIGRILSARLPMASAAGLRTR